MKQRAQLISARATLAYVLISRLLINTKPANLAFTPYLCAKAEPAGPTDQHIHQCYTTLLAPAACTLHIITPVNLIHATPSRARPGASSPPTTTVQSSIQVFDNKTVRLRFLSPSRVSKRLRAPLTSSCRSHLSLHRQASSSRAHSGTNTTAESI